MVRTLFIEAIAGCALTNLFRTLNPWGHESGLAASGGGGVDYALNDRVAVRVQGDYLMTRFLDARQDNIQLTAGLVVRIGSK